MKTYNFNADIKKMIEKYVAGTATTDEISFIESYYQHLENKELPNISAEEMNSLRKLGFEKLTRQTQPSTKRNAVVAKMYRYAAVAAILLLMLTGGYLFLKPTNIQKPVYATNKALDIAPGSNKAILTLAGGIKIILDDQQNGALKQTQGVSIVKTQDGQLVYRVLGKTIDNTTIGNNTIATPKGGQYQVVLPDGTKVWLNAASSLTYPELFKGSKRQVQLEGEAYFEVAKNKDMPFHVITKNQDVEVTGTHFNINGYMDENSINTTLLEGGVTVHSVGKSQKIILGQQARVSENLSVITVKTVNTDDEVAWKNGLFQFSNSSLKNILNQLERWYDIKVDYGSLPAKRYNGVLPRNAKLSEVLKMLELTGNIRFEILENRQLKVISQSNN